MKRILSVLRGHEKGQVMILALILLVVGVLIITPLLSYMGSGLKVGQVYEENMEELYAADSGVEDALWNLIIGGLEVFEGTPATLPQFAMNDTTVEVTIEYVDDTTFKITSEAYRDISEAPNTTVESYVSSPDFGDLLENVITSTKEVTLQPGVIVDPPEKIVDDYPEEDWPSDTDFISFYRSQVENAPSYIGDTIIEFDGTYDFGPAYVDGDLTLRSTENGATLMLQGTVYVTGTLTTAQNKEFTLDFNNHTIFVEDNTSYPPGAVVIGSIKTSVAGSGCLIAIGGINFGPNVAQGSSDDFLFVMSINDIIFIHPHGDFNGSFAGKLEVQLQPGSTITWNDPSDNDLNFPTGDVEDLRIRTWEINPP